MTHIITILGAGKVGRGKTVTAVEDLIASIPHQEGDEPTFLFPVLDKITPAQQYVAEWAHDLSYGINWFLGPDAEASISETLLDAAAAIIDSESGTFATEMVGEMGSDSRFLIAWDDAEEDDYDTLLKIASPLGIKAYDLTSALTEIVLEDEAEAEITVEAEVEVEPLTREDMLSDDWEPESMKKWLQKIREITDACRDEVNAMLSDALQEAWEDGFDVGKRSVKREAKERAKA